MVAASCDEQFDAATFSSAAAFELSEAARRI